MLEQSYHNKPPLGMDFVVVAGETTVLAQKKVPQGNRKYEALEQATPACAVQAVVQEQSAAPTLNEIVVMGSLEAMRQSDQRSVATLKQRMSALFDKALAS